MTSEPKMPGADGGPGAERDLEARAQAMREELAARVEAHRERLYRSPGPRRGSAFGRMRMVTLSALAIAVLVWAGRGSAGPLGVQASFTPAVGGASFAGHRTFEGGEERVTLVPGDVVGARGGAGAVLTLGAGRIELREGARAAVASLLPPRARLFGGDARVTGRLRVVTAHGIVDLEEGAAELELDERGLSVSVESGRAKVTTADGVQTLGSGESLVAR